MNSTSISIAQSSDIEDANDLFLSKSYLKAIPVFKTLLQTEENTNLYYKLGLCYFNLNKEISAIPYFEKAIKDVYKKYNVTNISLTHASVDAYYYFAKSQHVNGNIILAFEFYNKFFDVCKKKNPLRCKAYAGILQCEIAYDLLKHKTNDIIWGLGDTINTTANEYRPVMTSDGTSIFFTSARLRPDKTNRNFINPATGTYFEDIYVSDKTEDGKWTEPNYLPFCKPTQNEASISTTFNGDKLFVYNGHSGNGDVYTSEVEFLDFENLKPFPAKDLNTNQNESHASLSADGKYLFFVSDRKGGFGGDDIYRMKKLPDGTWSKAQNLGSTINSKFDEVSPFIGSDNRTLYFSSNGVKSMGGYDIFMSQQNVLEIWSEPKNLGFPLNSTDDDLYYSTTPDGFTGMFSSDRNLNQNHDIYFSQTSVSYYKNVTIFKGQIKTKSSNTLPRGITIEVNDLTISSSPVLFKPRLKDGVYILNLKPCHTYSIKYKYSNKTFYQIEKLVPCNSSYQEIHEEVILDLIKLK